MAGPSPGTISIPVGLRLDVLEPAGLFRVSLDVQVSVDKRTVYTETFSYQATWEDVILWLGTVLSSADASRTLADSLSLLRAA